MCGIAGIIYSGNSKDLQDIVKMNNIIQHRGPDDEGFLVISNDDLIVAGGAATATSSWSGNNVYLPKCKIDQINCENAQLVFAHRRLSILDLSAQGHQPMCDISERYWITFNGEIYNYIEIKKELQDLGYSFQNSSDTEVILVAYQHWGLKCQDHFNGMWSFAIYDKQEGKLFFSRDRYGIKPFYYWFNVEGDLFFSSEIKQFTTVTGWKALLNGPRAYDYLYYALTDHTDETLFKGVYAIKPGYCFEGSIADLLHNSKNGKIVTKKWYQPIIKTFNGSFEEAKDEFLQKFKDSIKLHLRADVAVGSALSGGLDSSSIVSYINILLRGENKSELQKTFSSCSEDKRFDERMWMEEVAKHIEIEGHYIYPKGEDVFNLTEKLVWHMDEPYQSQSAFLGYHVFEEASKKNVKVLLNGQGSDEYLSGYGDFRIMRHSKMLKQGKIFALYKELKSITAIGKLVASTVYGSFPANIRYAIGNRSSRNKQLDKLINFDKLITKKVHPYRLNNYEKKDTKEISNYMLLKEPLQKYLRWEDRNSMAHSIEARVPFLDYRLVELSHSMPIDYLDSPDHSKRILVEAMKGILPESVRLRKDKLGFITPEQRWFMTDFKEEYIDMLKKYIGYSKGVISPIEAEKFFKNVQNGNVPFNYTYWHLLQFCIWMKVYDVELN